MVFNDKSAEPATEQFWPQFDEIFDLSEEGMRAELDILITDPGNKAAVDALIEGRNAAKKLD